MIIDEDVYLEHFGVRGMKWGVRNDRKASDGAKSKSNVKRNVAIGLGSAAAVAAIAAGAYYAKKHYGVSASKAAGSSKEAAKFISDTAKEPTGVIHFSRGKHRGHGWISKGGLNEPYEQWKEAFGENVDPPVGTFKRFGKNLEKVGVVFNDPEGKRDFSGRKIIHTVILPKEHAAQIGTFEAARRKAWTLVKPTFNSLYDSALDRRPTY